MLGPFWMKKRGNAWSTGTLQSTQNTETPGATHVEMTLKGKFKECLEWLIEHTQSFYKQNHCSIKQAKEDLYRCIVCDCWKEKPKSNPSQLTIEGDRIKYSDDYWMPMVVTIAIKLLLNSIILEPAARFMNFDIQFFYLNTPLKSYKYLWLKVEDILEDVPVE